MPDSRDPDTIRLAKQAEMKERLPILANGTGVWEGTYTHLDPEGRIVDRHASRLLNRLASSGPHPYHQTNIYTWEDGRREVRDFRVDYEDGRLIYENDLISGFFTEIKEDPYGRAVMGYWRRHGLDGIYFYELIIRAGDHRNRVWQWIKDDGGIFRRTIIDERKVSDDTAPYEAEATA